VCGAGVTDKIGKAINSTSTPTARGILAFALGLAFVGAPALFRIGTDRTLVTELIASLVERKPTAGMVSTLVLSLSVFLLSFASDDVPKRFSAGGGAAVLLVYFLEALKGSSHTLLGIEILVCSFVLCGVHGAAVLGGFLDDFGGGFDWVVNPCVCENPCRSSR